jgi:hypothetical protein
MNSVHSGTVQYVGLFWKAPSILGVRHGAVSAAILVRSPVQYTGSSVLGRCQFCWCFSRLRGGCWSWSLFRRRWLSAWKGGERSQDRSLFPVGCAAHIRLKRIGVSEYERNQIVFFSLVSHRIESVNLHAKRIWAGSEFRFTPNILNRNEANGLYRNRILTN